jgi:hypothetical protein
MSCKLFNLSKMKDVIFEDMSLNFEFSPLPCSSSCLEDVEIAFGLV